MVMVVLRVAKEFDVVKFFVSKAGKARANRCVAESRCCACEEKFDGVTVVKHVCGMCQTCYNAARRAIRLGTKTQVDYIRSGEMLPPAGGRPAKNKFTRGLSKAKG